MSSTQTTFARKLRRNLTDSERLLWSRLRRRQLSGYKFRRQVPIGPYIVDFFCPERSLVIEIDGSQHADTQPAYDRVRDDDLERRGFRVLRFWNREVNQGLDAVIEVIWSELVVSSSMSGNMSGNVGGSTTETPSAPPPAFGHLPHAKAWGRE